MKILDFAINCYFDYNEEIKTEPDLSTLPIFNEFDEKIKSYLGFYLVFIKKDEYGNINYWELRHRLID